MSLEVRPVMKECINKAKAWLQAHERTRQWLWFVGLWFAGLFAVLSIAYPIKFVIKSIS